MRLHVHGDWAGGTARGGTEVRAPRRASLGPPGGQQGWGSTRPCQGPMTAGEGALATRGAGEGRVAPGRAELS